VGLEDLPGYDPGPAGRAPDGLEEKVRHSREEIASPKEIVNEEPNLVRSAEAGLRVRNSIRRGIGMNAGKAMAEVYWTASKALPKKLLTVLDCQMQGCPMHIGLSELDIRVWASYNALDYTRRLRYSEGGRYPQGGWLRVNPPFHLRRCNETSGHLH
jgi:hypothetical protein